ncbi:MAG: phosphopantothenoylcysteine decarboxylase [Candidatus Omnitrophica bacterium]|nr:phosphopantothenoylcysteine decarboxylase [Candidatus Omnitrophota bacterium]MBU4472563.1 phosphopantothenoylcysteine decarboxylase [Candidatus Omnitrophota bacterium]MCG2706834.1 phosphopantothenoylcysteine decarboxylase [Candidatus Omnitrophota bacterium]
MGIEIMHSARRKAQGLKNKRILITAGPTWVPIDKVRVISNIASGQTGILLATVAKKLGARVTLFLGPVSANGLDKSIRIRRFRFFNELKEKLTKELRCSRYDAIIHSAAVADFKPASLVKGKIKSCKNYVLRLKLLPKIIQDIRRLAPGAKLVMFKLEPGVSDAALVQKAKSAQQKARADVMVANRINPYRAFIIDRLGNAVSVRSKKELAKKLIISLGIVPCGRKFRDSPLRGQSLIKL